MLKLMTIAAAAAFLAGTTISYAETMAKDWALEPALSNVSFGSVKNDSIGESHSFGDVSGSVTADGVVTIKLGLPSVQTNIDVRDERMVEHVFKKEAAATITAQLDMAELGKLPVGEATTMDVSGSLNLLSVDTAIDASFFVMRVSENRVLVTTNGMIMLDLEEAGLTAGIDKLQELAKLDSITRVSPVTMRLVFDMGS